MSEHECKSILLEEVKISGNITYSLVDTLRICLKSIGVDTQKYTDGEIKDRLIDILYDEGADDEFYNNYVVHDGRLYNIKSIEDMDSIFFVSTRLQNGTIRCIVSYYNGCTGEFEAIEAALSNME